MSGIENKIPPEAIVDKRLIGEAYRVEAGDNLWNIAKKFKAEGMNTKTAMDLIADYNRIQNKSEIQAGRVIHLPLVNGKLDKGRMGVENRAKAELTQLKKFLEGEIQIRVKELVANARSSGNISEFLNSKSIIDTLNLLGVNSSLEFRKQLYKEIVNPDLPDNYRMNTGLLKKIKEMVNAALKKEKTPEILRALKEEYDRWESQLADLILNKLKGDDLSHLNLEAPTAALSDTFEETFTDYCRGDIKQAEELIGKIKRDCEKLKKFLEARETEYNQLREDHSQLVDKVKKTSNETKKWAETQDSKVLSVFPEISKVDKDAVKTILPTMENQIKILQVALRREGVLERVKELGGSGFDSSITIEGLEFKVSENQDLDNLEVWEDEAKVFWREYVYEGKEINLGIFLHSPHKFLVNVTNRDVEFNEISEKISDITSEIKRIKEVIDKESGESLETLRENYTKARGEFIKARDKFKSDGGKIEYLVFSDVIEEGSDILNSSFVSTLEEGLNKENLKDKTEFVKVAKEIIEVAMQKMELEKTYNGKIEERDNLIREIEALFGEKVDIKALDLKGIYLNHKTLFSKNWNTFKLKWKLLVSNMNQFISFIEGDIAKLKEFKKQKILENNKKFEDYGVEVDSEFKFIIFPKTVFPLNEKVMSISMQKGDETKKTMIRIRYQEGNTSKKLEVDTPIGLAKKLNKLGLLDKAIRLDSNDEEKATQENPKAVTNKIPSKSPKATEKVKLPPVEKNDKGGKVSKMPE